MKVNDMMTIQLRSFKATRCAAALLVAGLAMFANNVVRANGAYGTNTDLAGKPISVPTYFANSPQGLQPAWDPATNALKPGKTAGTFTMVDTGTPLRKFVDPLGGVYNGLEIFNALTPTDLSAGIPVAIPEPWVTPAGVTTGDDYYEVAVVEYTEQMHSDLPKATRLRGYVQIETPAIAAGLKDVTGLIGSEHILGKYPNGDTIYEMKKDPETGHMVQDTTKPVYFVHRPHYLGPSIIAFKGKPVRIKSTN